MPLPIDVQTLPLFLWESWRGQPWDLDREADFSRSLMIARAGNLVFWCLLLFYGWLAASRIAGPWAGRLAVAWLACEPNLLGHAALGTTDIAVSASLLALVYHFRTSREASWPFRVGVPAVCYAACLLAKASGLVFGPLCLFAVEVERLWSNGNLGSVFANLRRVPEAEPGSWQLRPRFRAVHAAFGPFRRDAASAIAIGLALTFLYCGSDWLPEPSFVRWARELPPGSLATSMIWLSEHLCVFPNAGEALVEQIGHGIRGHGGAYLLGHAYSKPVWYYFPLAMAIKLSLPLLVAPLVVAAVRRGCLRNWALLAAGALLLFSLNCRVQIGVRFMFPLIALGAVGIAAAIVQAAQESRSLLVRRFLTSGSILGLVWTSFAAWSVWPHGLCYANELWGGYRQTYLHLSDSNCDWGQGLKELVAWQADQVAGGRESQMLDVWYFGTDPAKNRPPLRHVPLHALPLSSADDVRNHVQGDYLAVGTTLLHGTYGLKTPAHQRAAEFLATRRVVARTATFLIFDVRQPESQGREEVARTWFRTESVSN